MLVSLYVCLRRDFRSGSSRYIDRIRSLFVAQLLELGEERIAEGISVLGTDEV